MSGLAGAFGHASELKSGSSGDDCSPKPRKMGVLSLEPQGITVLLVDGRPWTREALALALETACKVLRFGDPSDLAQADVQDGVTVILINVTGIQLDDNRVSAAIQMGRSRQPALPVVALSDSVNVDDILGAIERGLSGYIPISLELRHVVEALRFVALGGTFVPAEPVLAKAPLRAQRERLVREAATAALVNNAMSLRSQREPLVGEATTAALVKDAAAASILETLTPREVTVLEWLRQGRSNKGIARELSMMEATVKVHVTHIMKKLGAVNRTQVALLADGLVKKYP